MLWEPHRCRSIERWSVKKRQHVEVIHDPYAHARNWHGRHLSSHKKSRPPAGIPVFLVHFLCRDAAAAFFSELFRERWKKGTDNREPLYATCRLFSTILGVVRASFHLMLLIRSRRWVEARCDAVSQRSGRRGELGVARKWTKGHQLKRPIKIHCLFTVQNAPFYHEIKNYTLKFQWHQIKT